MEEDNYLSFSSEGVTTLLRSCTFTIIRSLWTIDLILELSNSEAPKDLFLKVNNKIDNFNAPPGVKKELRKLIVPIAQEYRRLFKICEFFNCEYPNLNGELFEYTVPDIEYAKRARWNLDGTLNIDETLLTVSELRDISILIRSKIVAYVADDEHFVKCFDKLNSIQKTLVSDAYVHLRCNFLYDKTFKPEMIDVLPKYILYIGKKIALNIWSTYPYVQKLNFFSDHFIGEYESPTMLTFLESIKTSDLKLINHNYPDISFSYSDFMPLLTTWPYVLDFNKYFNIFSPFFEHPYIIFFLMTRFLKRCAHIDIDSINHEMFTYLWDRIPPESFPEILDDVEEEYYMTLLNSLDENEINPEEFARIILLKIKEYVYSYKQKTPDYFLLSTTREFLVANGCNRVVAIMDKLYQEIFGPLLAETLKKAKRSEEEYYEYCKKKMKKRKYINDDDCKDAMFLKMRRNNKK